MTHFQLQAKLNRTQSKYTYNIQAFDELDGESAYWLGFIYADGNIYKDRLTIGLQARDRYVLEHFRSFLQADIPLHYRPRTNAYAVSIGNSYLAARLKMLGVVPRKASKIRYPKIISELGLDGAFIRGYFDGDGWIWISKKYERRNLRLGLASNRDFLDGLAAVIQEKVGISKPAFISNTPDKWRPVANPYHGCIDYQRQQDIKKIADFMCEDMGFFMERKLGAYYRWYYRNRAKVSYRQERNMRVQKALRVLAGTNQKLVQVRHKDLVRMLITQTTAPKHRSDHGKSRLPRELQETLCFAYRKGEGGVITLSRKYNVPRGQLRGCLKYNGVNTSKNYRPIRNITFNGKTQTLAEWAKETGISKTVLETRIRRWTIEKALTHPVKKDLDPQVIYGIRKDHTLSNNEMARKYDVKPNHVRQIRTGHVYKDIYPELIWKDMYKERLYETPRTVKIKFQGKEMKIRDWARETGICEGTIARRIRTGWSVGEALGFVEREKKGPQNYIKNKRLVHNGRSATYEEWSELTGLPVTTINSRVLANWPEEAVLNAAQGTRLEDYLQARRVRGLWRFLKFIL